MSTSPDETPGRMRLVYDDGRRGEWAEAYFKLDPEECAVRTPSVWLEGPPGTLRSVEIEIAGKTFELPIRRSWPHVG